MTLTNPRAKRYAISLPVRYRLAGSEVCNTGWTEDMSVSGLLFTTGAVLSVGAQVEVWVQMASDAKQGSQSILYCHGSVVRQVGGDADGNGGTRRAAALHIARLRVLPAVPDFAGMGFAPAQGEQL